MQHSKGKVTVVNETPEILRVKENQKNFSTVTLFTLLCSNIAYQHILVLQILQKFCLYESSLLLIMLFLNSIRSLHVEEFFKMLFSFTAILLRWRFLYTLDRTEIPTILFSSF